MINRIIMFLSCSRMSCTWSALRSIGTPTTMDVDGRWSNPLSPLREIKKWVAEIILLLEEHPIDRSINRNRSCLILQTSGIEHAPIPFGQIPRTCAFHTLVRLAEASASLQTGVAVGNCFLRQDKMRGSLLRLEARLWVPKPFDCVGIASFDPCEIQKERQHET